MWQLSRVTKALQLLITQFYCFLRLKFWAEGPQFLGIAYINYCFYYSFPDAMEIELA